MRQFFDRWKTLLDTEALYTSTIIQGYSDQPQSDKRKQAILLTKEGIRLLKLTAWQVRALLLPGSFPNILTNCQESMFRKLDPEANSSSTGCLDAAKMKPTAILDSSPYPDDIEADHKVCINYWEALNSLSLSQYLYQLHYRRRKVYCRAGE
ncbi:hypothetical protein RRF57_008715 [Xylaria bambusicola]|uniref:Uncharacterized protein n=1 Tax=Xylaria bambusicola TaxID=326684 RepID=A0AAN7UUC9_9PEZI